MRIQAVFFDMGGTIETFWHDRQMRLEATPELNQQFLSFGIDLGLNNLELFEIIHSGLDKYHKWAVESLVELSTARVWKEFIFFDYPQFFPILEKKSEELMLWVENHYYKRALRPEVPNVLEKLRTMGIKIGLISNVCSLGQVAENLKKYGIIQYFDPIVTSSAYRRRKPDPAIFHKAAFLAKVSTSHSIYVGDRITRDILGAKKAGYRLAVQIRHDYKHGELDEGSTPDAIIDLMSELIAIIENENSKPDHGIQEPEFIKALLFDAGDILYYRPRRGQLFKDFLKINGLGEIPTSINKDSLKNLAYSGAITRDDYFRELIKSYGLTDPQTVEHGVQILQEADDEIVFFEGVRSTLKTLKENGYYLGIITDSAVPVYLKLSWFEKGGFVDVWDSYISSQEIGVQKPDPKIYMAALEQLGLQPEQAAFIGHNPGELFGARALGIYTIAFNPDTEAQADVFVKSFQDILTVPRLKSNSTSVSQ